ncbi:T6SS immunity protein Tdi1 domain-containing protein [Niveibacterium microcysteis]|uniref:DUF1851 domain-containing protein n=1 Tax=Niveibacterium microcysteis TaxID=2811415 RepID=A0ABX7M5D9_9RHOO|nr:T6SS immunity protein Tdi1 domain-containing protein [Niveibacterium microcysteis]QSI76646.1 DUF1851 domain-containing protein [Niveibacterium microcysteis]
MTLDDLTVNFKHLRRETVLEDWVWLIGNRKLPILLAAAGDAFVQDTEDGTIHMLDVAAGKSGLVAQSAKEFQSLLSDREFVGQYLCVQLVGDLRMKGLVLKPRQIYSFIKPPLLGGEYSLDNIEACDIEVHYSLNGQIARQVSALPPGTPISNITIVDKPKKKPRWRFW